MWCTDILITGTLQVIARIQQDANLQYIYKGPQKKSRGGKRTNGGKVHVTINI